MVVCPGLVPLFFFWVWDLGASMITRKNRRRQVFAMIDNTDYPNGIKQKYVVPHGCMSWPRPPFLPHRHQSDHLIFARVRDKSRVSKQMHVNLTKELERKRGNVKVLRIFLVWFNLNSVNDSYAMRILERVQPFCTSFSYWEFNFFPRR